MRNFWLLDRQNKSIAMELRHAVDVVIESNAFIAGEQNKKCEEEMALAFGVRHVVLTSSGTTALQIAGRAIALAHSRNYQWEWPHVSFVASRNAAFDINTSIDWDDEYTMASMVVDLYGLPYFEIPLFEPLLRDSCQAHNLALAHQLPGNSLASTLSFFPTKAIGAFGDAGAVLTNDDDIAAFSQQLRDHGRVKHCEELGFGYNYRCDEIQASVLRTKLWKFPEWQERRRNICSIFDTITNYDHSEYGPYLYPIWVESGMKTPARLTCNNNGVPTAEYYKEPLTETDNSIDFCNRVLCLNPDPFLTEEEIEKSITALSRIKPYLTERPSL